MATFTSTPIASSVPNVLFDPMAVDAAISKLQTNRLYQEDLRSQIDERDAQRRFRETPGDYGGPAGAQPAAANGAAAPATAYGAGGPGASVPVPPEYLPLYQAASAKYGIPVDILIAQHRQESGFNPNATGTAGEIGLGQIKPSTARDPGYGVPGVQNPDTLRDPATNIDFSAAYLKGRAGANVNWSDPKQAAAALAAYNGGGDPNYVANVTRYLPAQGGTQQAASAPGAAPQQPGGVAARTGGTDVAGPGGAPPSGRPDAPPAELAAIANGARTLLAMPEAGAAAAYPTMVKQLQSQGYARNAPPTYPGHAAIEHLATADTPTPAVAPGAQAPTGASSSAVPPPTPPAPVNERGLTNDDRRVLDNYRKGGGTRSGEATLETSLRQHNLALQATYRNEQQQAQTHADTLRQQGVANARADEGLALQRAAEKRAQAEADAKEAARKKASAEPEFHGDAEKNQTQHILRYGDPKSPEYLQAWGAVRADRTHISNTGLVQQPTMSEFRPPIDSAGNPVTNAGESRIQPGPSAAGIEAARVATVEHDKINSAIDNFVSIFKEQGGGSFNAWIDNPRSEQAQKINGAFGRMLTAVRSPSYFNTGVLQPAELAMMKQQLVSPESWRGLFATPEGMIARLGEIKKQITVVKNVSRRMAGMSEEEDKSDETPAAAPANRPPLASFQR